MNLVVNDGLKLVIDSVNRVCNVVRSVRASPTRIQRFRKCALDEKIQTKSSVCLDGTQLILCWTWL